MSAKEPEAPAAAESAASTKSGPPVMIVAAALLVVLFAGGFALAYFVLPGRIVAQLKAELEAPSDSSDPEARKPEAAAPAHPPADSGHGTTNPAAGNAHSAAGTTTPAPAEFTVENLVVNISGSRSGRFVRVSLAFDADPNVIAELNAQRPRVIDLIGSTLATKSEDELRATTARGLLRTEIVNSVNPILRSGQVRAVFFLEYLIQP